MTWLVVILCWLALQLPLAYWVGSRIRKVNS
jgi:hypothetical protein